MITLFMAMSANGIVAREDDSEDFLPHYGWEKFVSLTRDAGGFIIGRRTYEIVQKNYKDFGFDYLEGMKKIVVSKKGSDIFEDDIIWVKSPEEVIKRCKEFELSNLILTGGPTLNTAFAKLGLIDRLIVNIEPVIIGHGYNIFKPDEFDLKMEMINFEKHKSGGLTCYYKVI